MTLNPVRGQVFYDGRPAKGVEATLYPVRAPNPPEIPKNPTATSDDQGRLAFGTYQPADGAAAGEYEIVLRWPKPAPAGAPPRETEAPDMLHGMYNIRHTNYKFTVAPGNNEIPPIKLAATQQPAP